jgi:hypothetical protein
MGGIEHKDLENESYVLHGELIFSRICYVKITRNAAVVLCVCDMCVFAFYVARFPLFAYFSSDLISSRRQYPFDPLC